MHKYALRYNLNEEWREEGFTAEEAGENGLCDALIGISVILPEDGSYSQAVFSSNGKEKRECTQKEIFKAWLMLGLSLHDTGKLEGWQKEFVTIHSSMIREFFSHKENCPTNSRMKYPAKKRKKK